MTAKQSEPDLDAAKSDKERCRRMILAANKVLDEAACALDYSAKQKADRAVNASALTMPVFFRRPAEIPPGGAVILQFPKERIVR